VVGVPEYTKSEAKDWAREKFRGIENVLIPSLKPTEMGEGKMLLMDEAGIRYDVNMVARHGFFMTTVACEGIHFMLQEMILRPYYEWVVDENKGRVILDAYICNNTIEEQINNVKIAEETGIDCVMVAFAPSFYPRSEDDIYEYFKTICDSTNLAVVAYPSHKYNFERFHPSGFNPRTIERIAHIENVVAMKRGVVDMAHTMECIRRFGDVVMLNQPMISWWPVCVMELGMKWAGSAPYEYLQTPENPRLVEHFNLLLDGKMDEAMEIFWDLKPARDVWEEFQMPQVAEGSYNFMHWKYVGWLTGMNGGPMYLSTPRIYEHEKERYKEGLRKIGITPREPDEEFYVGRVNYSGSK
jgi:4-hydroxy-tetrahydrodipicolinate synthase